MKTIFRILSLVLIITVLSGCVLACDSGDDEGRRKNSNSDSNNSESVAGGSDSESESSQNGESESSSSNKKPSTNNKNPSRIMVSDLKNYKFVVSANASDTLKATAKHVCEVAGKTWESDAVLKTDDYATASQEKYEILIGETNRTESIKHKAKTKVGEGGYALEGTKLTILGYSESETIAALQMFLVDYVMGTPSSSIFFTDSYNFQTDLSDYVSIMSFNVYVYIESDAEKKANVIKFIRAYSPDVFGVQEASAKWQVTLKDEFSKDYHIVGTGRDGNGNGEASLIFAKKSKFNIKSSGTKWLSSTPDRVSKVAEAALNRIVTYAVIERISDGKIFNYANTHLDHVGGQEEQVGYLCQIIDNNMQKGAPTFVTGDFNMTPDVDAFAKMKSLGYTPSSDLATKNDSKGIGTMHSSSGVIDYLFVRNGMNVETYLYRICNEDYYGKGSDHHPIFNIVKF